MIDELAELVAMYDRGAWSRGDFMYQVTLFVPEVSVQSIVDQLPASLRDEFVGWLREAYDNDVPVDDFVSIGQQDDPAQKQLRLEALRAWLHTDSNDKRLR
jgi:hypothetical protein